jgi:hypothetical protein
MKKALALLIIAALNAGPNFSQEDPEKETPEKSCPGRGYRAVEFGVTETAPVNISLKIGLDKIYLSLYFSYNLFESNISNQVSCGIGFGSIFSAGKFLFFNPEFIFSRGLSKNFRIYLSFVPYLGFSLPQGMEFLFGPALSWSTGKDHAPLFLKLREYKINGRQTLSLNGRAVLRIQW